MYPLTNVCILMTLEIFCFHFVKEFFKVHIRICGWSYSRYGSPTFCHTHSDSVNLSVILKTQSRFNEALHRDTWSGKFESGIRSHVMWNFNLLSYSSFTELILFIHVSRLVCNLSAEIISKSTHLLIQAIFYNYINVQNYRLWTLIFKKKRSFF